MNPLLILGPIGMLVVGLASIAYWGVKGEVKLKYFLWGGAVWIAATTPKAIMDFTVTPALNSWALGALGTMGMLAVSGLYVGLRTGILECGLTYIALSKTRLRRITLAEAVAFGVGFGAFEAILIALPSLAQILAFTLNPSLLQSLPEEARQAVEAQLNMPTWVVLAPAMERAFVILVHVFTTLMIYASIKEGDLRLLAGAILYKTVLDALVPYLQWLLKPATSPTGIYLAEAWPALMGLIALAGIRRYLRPTLNRESPQKEQAE